MQANALRVALAAAASAVVLIAFGAIRSDTASAGASATTASFKKDGATPLAQMKAEYRRPATIPFPKDNPYTVEKASLGKKLFFDTRLSAANILIYAFKTPGLREISLRGPYMHDGSVPTLEAVMDHYNRGGIDRPSRSEQIKPLGSSKQECADLVAFMKTLTSDLAPTSAPLLPR